MSNINDFKNKNTIFTGTDSIQTPKGTTAQRNGSPVTGMLRYNTTIGLLENYNDAGWAGIDAPPVVSSISPTDVDGNIGTGITITGSNFKSNSTVSIIDTNGAVASAGAVTFTNNTTLVATLDKDYDLSKSPLSFKVSNPSGLSAEITDALTLGAAPAFSTAAGNLGTVVQGASASFTISATDADSSTPTLSLKSGSSMPAGGVAFADQGNGSATISGTVNSGGSGTITHTFTVEATDAAGNVTERTFNFTEQGPLYAFTSHTFTNAGATGKDGPSTGQCQSAYSGAAFLASHFTTSGGIQYWTVPATANYRFQARGANGACGSGASSATAGQGISIDGYINLTSGEVVRMLVGQNGSRSGSNGGGGGGTFVTKSPHNNDASIIVVAGGGGGVRQDSSGGQASPDGGKYGESGNGTGTYDGTFNSNVSGGNYGQGGQATSLGQGGRDGQGAHGDGGAGFFGNGNDDGQESNPQAQSYQNGGQGGHYSPEGNDGGFGGGGSGSGSNGGGGGGGYTGGNGGHRAGSGGSYHDNMTSVTHTLDGNTTTATGNTPYHGFVTITKQ